MDGKCKNGAKYFNTPFVLARHRAHRLLDGLLVEGEYQGSSRKFEAARKHADGELCHDETLLRKRLFLAIWRQSASDEDPESLPSSGSRQLESWIRSV